MTLRPRYDSAASFVIHGFLPLTSSLDSTSKEEAKRAYDKSSESSDIRSVMGLADEGAAGLQAVVRVEQRVAGRYAGRL